MEGVMAKTEITVEVGVKYHLCKECETVKALREALVWCGGSPDFNEGGQAREGWLKVCAPLLK
jgi:hypothetical protein